MIGVVGPFLSGFASNKPFAERQIAFEGEVPFKIDLDKIIAIGKICLYPPARMGAAQQTKERVTLCCGSAKNPLKMICERER